MELFRLSVLYLNQLGLVFVEDVSCHICFRAKCEIEHLIELTLGHLLSEEISEFVDSNSSSYSRGRRLSRYYLLIPIANGNILKNIAFMQDISSPKGS